MANKLMKQCCYLNFLPVIEAAGPRWDLKVSVPSPGIILMRSCSSPAFPRKEHPRFGVQFPAIARGCAERHSQQLGTAI